MQLVGGLISFRPVKRISSLAVLSAAVMATTLVSATNAWAGSVPELSLPGHLHGFTVGPDGNFWLTEGNPNRIAKLTPRGKVTYFSAGISGSPGFIIAGPGGDLWFTDRLPGINNAQDVARITPSGIVTEFPMAAADGSGIFVESLSAGPDGDVWFTGTEKQCARTGTPSEPPPPLPVPQPTPPPPPSPALVAMVTESCGQFIRVGKFTGAGPVTLYRGPEAYPASITAGPDGNLWFVYAGGRSGQTGIDKITPSGLVTQYSLGSEFPNRPASLTAGPDGNLWFPQGGANRIGKITPGGVVTTYSVGKPCIQPLDIAAGPDGNLWFTCHTAYGRIGRITTTGKVTYYRVREEPGGPFAGPGGYLWYVEGPPNRNPTRIVRFATRTSPLIAKHGKTHKTRGHKGVAKHH